jgi:hypothetical protein
MRERTRNKLMKLIDEHEAAAKRYAERPCTTRFMVANNTRDALLEAIGQNLPEVVGDIRRAEPSEWERLDDRTIEL